MALPGNTDYQSVLSDYRAKLAKSPTAITPGVKPTRGDIALDAAYLRAQKQKEFAEGSANRAAYYPKDTGDKQDTEPKSTRLQTFFKVIGAPLSAGAGLVEAALGKGTKPGLDNVVANVKEGGTYGDIIRSYNVPNIIAGPLGFGLDVMMDPLGWATLGTGAFVPRVAEGAIAGGVRGAGLAAKTGALQVGESVGRLVPWLERSAYPTGADAVKKAALEATAKAEGRVLKEGPLVRGYKALSEASVKAAKEYDALRGTNMLGDILEKGAKGSEFGRKIVAHMSGLDTATGEVVSPRLNKLSKLIIGSPLNWFQESVAKDAVMTKNFKRAVVEAPEELTTFTHTDVPSKASIIESFSKRGTAEAMVPEKKVFFEKPTLADNAADAARIANNPPAVQLKNPLDEVPIALAAEARNVVSDAEQVQEAIKYLTLEKIDPEHAAAYLAKTGKELKRGLLADDNPAKAAIEKMTPEKQAELVGVLKSLKTDLAEVDRTIASRLAQGKIATKVLDNYIKFNAFFKVAVVPYNIPGAYINKIMGDLTTAILGGLDTTVSSYRNTYMKALKFARSGKVEESLDLMLTPGWKELARVAPGTFRDVFKVDPRIILDFESLADDAAHDVSVALNKKSISGKVGGVTPEEVRGILFEAKEKAVLQGIKNQSSVTKLAMQGSAPTTLTEENMVGAAGRMINGFKTKGENGSAIHKALYQYFTWAPEKYGKFDQITRLTNAMHLSSSGITMSELRTMSKAFGITREDVISIPGRTLVKLTPMKAMEVASRLDINYDAMPAAIRLLRMTPIIGQPFASFTYGMAQQVSRAALFNPAAFNRMQWALREISGAKEPLEKEALDSDYYSWMNSPTMIKTPIFLEHNPVYMNIAKMVDFYSIGLLQQPNRDYGEKYGGKIAALIDQVPFFKQPEGQVMLDYLIMPHLIQSSMDEGQFGQPLYPVDATVGQKVASGVSSLVNPVIPLAAGYSALIPGLSDKVPNSVLPYTPYKFKTLANALKGRTSAGVPTKQNPTEKTVLATARVGGLPLYKLNLPNAQKFSGE